MKELKSVLWVLMITLVVSCKKDEPNQIIEEPTGKVALEFQNVYQDGPFVLHKDYTTPPPMEQKIIYSRFTYMISDISLVNDKGEEIKYHHTNPDKGAFLLVHHGNTTPKEIELKQIPIGTYTKVKLRVGLSNAAWKLGENQQQTFWNASRAVGMTWDSWAKGYKHFNLEGTWGEEAQAFSVQIGNIPSENRERSIELTLSLPENLIIKKDETKNIRFEVNVSAVFGGKNKITITKENAIVQDESNEIFSKIIENFTANVFKAASVY